MNVNITAHAYQRAKERLRWDQEKTKSTAQAAYSSGKSYSEISGRLKKYIGRLVDKQADNIKLFAGIVFIFEGTSLITVYELPLNMKNLYYKTTCGFNYK
jgi:hypothetical protein